MTRFGLGLVIGKFLPPHRGHAHLIEAATSRCDRTVVIVCEKPSDFISGEIRASWMREEHPTAEVRVIDDRYDAQDSAVWARNTLEWLGRAPDAVFSSEDYGDRYAALMGSEHVMVDRGRVAVPCSATMIRRDPFAAWEFLGASVRAWFALRVCVLGAESTGTTTLAEALADHYRTTWVPEYGREYSAIKQEKGEDRWTADEFFHIAREQNRREEMAAREANRVVIGDTNSVVTRLWQRRYLGFETDEVVAEGARARCDLYLLTGDEIPFVQDGLRDGEHVRHAMHEWFEAMLRAQKVPWRLIRGTHDERLAEAISAIDERLVPVGQIS